MKYFANLFLRNVKGTFLKGFVPIDTYLFLLYWIIHLALLPITLTLGAGIKTLIDYNTRKFVSNDIIEERKNKISQMNEKDMSELRSHFANYACQSNSSKMLLKLLSDLDKLDNLPPKKLEKQKEFITIYINEDKNNGKKLFQIILGLFTPPQKKQYESINDPQLTNLILNK